MALLILFEKSSFFNSLLFIGLLVIIASCSRSSKSYSKSHSKRSSKSSKRKINPGPTVKKVKKPVKVRRLPKLSKCIKFNLLTNGCSGSQYLKRTTEIAKKHCDNEADSYCCFFAQWGKDLLDIYKFWIRKGVWRGGGRRYFHAMENYFNDMIGNTTVGLSSRAWAKEGFMRILHLISKGKKVDSSEEQLLGHACSVNPFFCMFKDTYTIIKNQSAKTKYVSRLSKENEVYGILFSSLIGVVLTPEIRQKPHMKKLCVNSKIVSACYMDNCYAQNWYCLPCEVTSTINRYNVLWRRKIDPKGCKKQYAEFKSREKRWDDPSFCKKMEGLK